MTAAALAGAANLAGAASFNGAVRTIAGALGLPAQSDMPEDGIADAFGRGLTWEDWVLAAAVLTASVIIGRAAQAVVTRLVERTDADEAVSRLVGKAVRSIFILGGLVYGLVVLDVRVTPLLGAIGIGGLALAFAGQTILADFFASILLRTRRPFRRGDQIRCLGHQGIVEEVNFRVVVLRTFDHTRVLLPAAGVLAASITNYTTHGRRRTTLEVGVAYRTDLRHAQRVMLDAVVATGEVMSQPRPEVWATEFGESSINFEVRYYHEPTVATEFRVRSDVAMAIKAAFDVEGIEIPFPQRVLNYPVPGDLASPDRPSASTRPVPPGGGARAAAASVAAGSEILDTGEDEAIEAGDDGESGGE